jgi:hypothetical protein
VDKKQYVRQFNFPQISKDNSGVEYFSRSLFSDDCEIPSDTFTIQKGGQELSTNIHTSFNRSVVGYIGDDGYFRYIQKSAFGPSDIVEQYFRKKAEISQIQLQQIGNRMPAGVSKVETGIKFEIESIKMKSLAFGPDGTHFAIGHENGLISIWNFGRKEVSGNQNSLVKEACKRIGNAPQIQKDVRELFRKGPFGLFGQDNDPYRTNCPENTR